MFLNNIITRSVSSSTTSLESNSEQTVDKPSLINRCLSFNELSSSTTTTTTVKKRGRKRRTSNSENTTIDQQPQQLFEAIEDTLVDDNSNNSIECNQCSKILASEFGLIRHFDMHHPTLSVLCSQCNIVFKSHRSLKSHLHRHHSKHLYHHHSRYRDLPEQSSLSRYNTRTAANITTTFTSLDYLPNYSYITSYLIVAFSSKQFPIIAKLACEQKRLPLGVLTSKLYQCTQCSMSFPCSRTLRYHSVTHHDHSEARTCSNTLEYIISQLEDEDIQSSYEILNVIIITIETNERKPKQEIAGIIQQSNFKPHHSPLTTTVRTVTTCSSSENTTISVGGDDDSGFGSEYYLSPLSDIMECNMSASTIFQSLRPISNISNEQQQDQLHPSQQCSTDDDLNDFDSFSSLLSSCAYQFGLVDKRLSKKLTKIKLQQQRHIQPQCLHPEKTCANLCSSHLSSYSALIGNYAFDSQITSIPKGSLGQIVPKLPAKRPPLLTTIVPTVIPSLFSTSIITTTTTTTTTTITPATVTPATITPAIITLPNEQTTIMKRRYQKQNRAVTSPVADTQLVPVTSTPQFSQELEQKNTIAVKGENRSVYLNERTIRKSSKPNNIHKKSTKVKENEVQQQKKSKSLVKTQKKRAFDLIDTSVTISKRFQISPPSNSQSLSKTSLFPKSILPRKSSKEKCKSISRLVATPIHQSHRKKRILSPLIKTPISSIVKHQTSTHVKVEEKQKKRRKKESVQVSDEQENEDDDNEPLSTYQRKQRHASNGSNHSVEYVQTIELNNIENTKDVKNTNECTIIDLENNEHVEYSTSPKTVNKGDDEIVICNSPSPKKKYSKFDQIIHLFICIYFYIKTIHNDEDDILFRCKVCADILYGRKNFANHVFNTHPTLLKQNLAKKQVTTTR
ncbi:unnamed protein product [Didymodactylos carnosus]|uniref:C2H2-type domain-containing protein n=1 Tax=Didymodactylos carnosus TaxID=1234261 RepID=A0A813QDV4_9BILA|nr:unnamed protein product [Didymodactylos carnosus]CAF0765640.1 unnamed protein product [Didymodactylos carnosus]CAF3530737.1 unnamed protein product [Didymodactylos carnosus]CAF3546972.1 unnamed protein product [Didymodactylos carnosus]